MKHVLLARHGPFIFHTLSFHYGNCDRRPLPNSLYFLPSVFCRFMATNDAPIDHVFNSKLFNHNNMLWNNWSRFCIYVDHYLQLQLLPLTQEDLWRRNCAVTRPSTSNIEVVGVAWIGGTALLLFVFLDFKVSFQLIALDIIGSWSI